MLLFSNGIQFLPAFHFPKKFLTLLLQLKLEQAKAPHIEQTVPSQPLCNVDRAYEWDCAELIIAHRRIGKIMKPDDYSVAAK
jgi:hypothetical protein